MSYYFKHKHLWAVFLGLLWVQMVSAQNFVEDTGGYLKADEIATLEEKLKNYSDSTTNQIAIRTIQSLEGQSLRKYSLNLAKELGVGQKEKNNGVLVLLAKEERKVRIEVGLGLESMITNLEADRVIHQALAPNLKAGQNFQALHQATDSLIAIIQRGALKSSAAETLKIIDIPDKEGFTQEELGKLANMPSELKAPTFVVDYGEFISTSQMSKLNRKLNRYAESTDACIWIRTLDEDFLSIGYNGYTEKVLFKHLIHEYPGKTNYAIIFVEPSTFYESEMSAHILLKSGKGEIQDEFGPDLQMKEIISEFNDEVLHHYFEVNNYFRYWPYPGLTRTVYLLQKLHKDDLDVEDIRPSFYYSNSGSFYFYFLFPIGGAFLLMILVGIFKGFGGGNSGGGSGGFFSSSSSLGSSSSSSSGSWFGGGYEGGSSGGGSSGGGGSSFGGGDFGGGGSGGDY